MSLNDREVSYEDFTQEEWVYFIDQGCVTSYKNGDYLLGKRVLGMNILREKMLNGDKKV